MSAQTALDDAIVSDASAGVAVMLSNGDDLSNSSRQPADVPVVDGATTCLSRPPAYPPAAMRQGQQGTVLLRVMVADDGMPVRITIARSSGFPLLDDAARASVARQTFAVERAPVDGGNDGLLVPVSFVLNDAETVDTTGLKESSREE